MKKFLVSLMLFSIVFYTIGCSAQEENKLTLDKVIELSQKSKDLSWSDFENYESREIGSGLYILMYEIDKGFSLLIGGTPDQEPMYIRLTHDTNQDGFVDNDDFIDIREGAVEEFIKKYETN